MTRQITPVEFNTFVGGLVTDAGPLTFPSNSSIAEDNMVLGTTGLRQRRLGMDLEDNSQEITTSISYSPINTYGHSSFKWDNAGSDINTSLLVIQFGNEIKIFNLSNQAISSDVVHTHNFDVTTIENEYSYAVIDGVLVVVTGEKLITSFEYDITLNTITSATNFLKVRDLFGVQAVVDAVDLGVGNDITVRPASITDNHKYNLRNQSWGVPRMDAGTTLVKDPISTFLTASTTAGNAVYPSNSDSVNRALYPDPGVAANRVIDRFFAGDLVTNKFGSTHAPVGHYIIDALERGVSRKTEYDRSVSESLPTVMLPLSAPLLEDKTTGGPSVISQWASRVWYSGFKGVLVGGDDNSPRLSSYVFFSRFVNNLNDLVSCYQDGDPTSTIAPDLLDNDGGFIKVDGAFDIQKMISLEDSLFVVAKNGIWSIKGTSNNGFTASGYIVTKVTDRGSISSGSVVQVESSFSYWGEDGIYSISKNQFGDWVASNISNQRINNLYSNLSETDTKNVRGHYDGFDKKVRWLYANSTSFSGDVRELVLDTVLGAFYTNTIFTPSSTTLPKVVGIFQSSSFISGTTSQIVNVGNDVVQVGGVDIVADGPSLSSSIRQIKYIAITDISSVIKYSFSFYKDETFNDWSSISPVDAEAFMVTGYISGGEFQHDKQVLSISVYCNKTESGFITDINGDLSPVNSSSVRLQSQWNWTNSSTSHLWRNSFEAYRHNRLYTPLDVLDSFDDGHSVVLTKNRLRGKGRVLSIKFSTSPNKDFQLWGWSMLFGINQHV